MQRSKGSDGVVPTGIADVNVDEQEAAWKRMEHDVHGDGRHAGISVTDRASENHEEVESVCVSDRGEAAVDLPRGDLVVVDVEG